MDFERLVNSLLASRNPNAAEKRAAEGPQDAKKTARFKPPPATHTQQHEEFHVVGWFAKVGGNENESDLIFSRI